MRVWELCRALKDRYSFHLAAFAPPGLADGSIEAQAYRLRLGAVFDGADLVPWAGPAEDLWFGFWKPEVRDGPSFRKMGEAIQAALRRVEPDLVQIEFVQMAACRRFVWGPPVVFVEHDMGWVDLRHRLWERANGRAGARPLWGRVLDWARLRWDYGRRGGDFDGVVTAGLEDLAWWRHWGPGDAAAEWVPNAADPERFPLRRREPPERRPELLFVGYYPHPPNAEAARTLLREIWPLVRREAPAARLTFVGADPPRWLLDARGEGVRVTGYVPDLLPYLHGAHAFLAPVALGRGNKGKLAEAFAAGVPVVASPEALRGFGPEAAGLVRLGADAPSFAFETVNLLKNKRLRSELSLKARRWVEHHLTWQICAERLDRFYQTVLKAPGAAFRQPRLR